MWTIAYKGYFINGYCDKALTRVVGPAGYQSRHASLDAAKRRIRMLIRIKGEPCVTHS